MFTLLNQDDKWKIIDKVFPPPQLNFSLQAHSLAINQAVSTTIIVAPTRVPMMR
jgi:hypothetical protein